MAAPRSLWNGTIAFGAVAVPVKLHTLVEPGTVHFHEVHLDDGAKVEHRRFCTKEDKEVPKEEVARGYEIKQGTFVIVDKEEADAAAGDRGRRIDVEHVVATEEIDPVFYAKPYALGAGDGGEDAYRLLHDALSKTARSAIGRFTFHKREYLVAIRPYEGVLALHELRFADELVDPSELDLPRAGKKPEKREIDMAGQLVETLASPFEHDRYEDEYAEVVRKAARDKSKGKELATEPPAEPEGDDDNLLAALEASMKGR